MLDAITWERCIASISENYTLIMITLEVNLKSYFIPLRNLNSHLGPRKDGEESPGFLSVSYSETFVSVYAYYLEKY